MHVVDLIHLFLYFINAGFKYFFYSCLYVSMCPYKFTPLFITFEQFQDLNYLVFLWIVC